MASELEVGSVKAETYRSGRSDGDVYIQAATASDFVAIGTQVSSNLLKVDGSGNVGVGNSAPTAPLEVSKSAASTESVISTFSTTDADHSILNFKKSGSATIGTKAVTADGEVLGSIGAYGVDTNSDQRRSAQIEFNQAAAATGSKVAGDIVFKTSSTSANDVEAVRITSDGSVGIGTLTPTVGNLQIRDASVSTFALTRTTGNTGASLGIIRFGNTDVDSNLANIVGYQDGATDSAAIAFQTQPTGGSTTTRLTIASTGLATFGAGVNLGNTVSATATTLDGYEEGTFTVTNNGDTSGVISSETGEYTRIGNCVFIRVAIRVGTTFANNRIGGLPFGCVTDGATSSWSPIGTALTGSATNAPILVAAQNGVANLSFFKQGNTNLPVHLPSTSEDYYRVTGCYYTTDAF